MLEVPIKPIPSQNFRVVLEQQNFEIKVYQKNQKIFVDTIVNSLPISMGVIARDAVPVVSRDYAGIKGNLIFADTQGESDPIYDGLGDRYRLLYLTESEYG